MMEDLPPQTIIDSIPFTTALLHLSHVLSVDLALISKDLSTLVFSDRCQLNCTLLGCEHRLY